MGPRIEVQLVARFSLEQFGVQQITPEFLNGGEVIYNSPRTKIFLVGGTVFKEQQLQYDWVGVVDYQEELEKALQATSQEADFWASRFPGFVPSYAVVTGWGSQGVETVFTVQDFVKGPMLSQVDVSPNEDGARSFWERVLQVYALEKRLPDLQADRPVHLLGKNLPDPFHTVNVILSDVGPMLVDVEERMGHWSHRTALGRYAVCPTVSQMIRLGLARPGRAGLGRFLRS